MEKVKETQMYSIYILNQIFIQDIWNLHKIYKCNMLCKYNTKPKTINLSLVK